MSDPIENGLSDDEAFPPLPPPQSPNRWDQGDGEPFADGKKKKKTSYTFRTVRRDIAHKLFDWAQPTEIDG